VDLGQAELPRRPDVLDRRQRRGPGPAGMTGQVDVARAGLGDAGGDRPDAAGGDELDADPSGRIDRPQVSDELGEVLDRVDVVVRRRTDVAHPGLAAAEGGDVGGRLAGGQLAAFARLRALGDLYLELVGAGEIRGRDAETGRGDLLDLRVVALASRRRDVPGRILATLAGVGRTACPLDADRQRLMGLRRQRPDAHRRDDEAADDLARGFDTGEVDRPDNGGGTESQTVADDRARPIRGGSGRSGCRGARDAHATAERDPVPAECFVERSPVFGLGRQRLDLTGDLRREEVGLAVGLEAGEARVRQLVRRDVGGQRPRGGRPSKLALPDGRQTDRAEPGRGAREAAPDELRVELDGLEQDAADVGGNRADAHPGERLAQPGLERGKQVADRRVG